MVENLLLVTVDRGLVARMGIQSGSGARVAWGYLLVRRKQLSALGQ
jgi:hypothetical protein